MIGQVLKELLKPPFKWRFFEAEDSAEHYLFGDTCGDDYSDEIAGEIRNFVTAAMNEKWERDNGDSLLWIIDDEYGYRGVRCPKCGNEYECYFEDIKESWKYCPHCGQRLGPPEVEQVRGIKRKADCQHAGKTADGKCVGYQKSELDDEPCDMCMDCQESQFYEDDNNE